MLFIKVCPRDFVDFCCAYEASKSHQSSLTILLLYFRNWHASIVICIYFAADSSLR